MSQLSRNITNKEGEPGYVLPANATFTALTCSTLSYLDDSGNQMDLETEIEQLKTMNTSNSNEAQTSAENAATSENNAATSASNAAVSANNAATSASNAAVSASNAATSESNAAVSASNATT